MLTHADESPRPRRRSAASGLLERAGRLGALLSTPLVPDDYVALVDPLLSTTELRGRVVEVRPEAARAATLRIRPSRAWQGHRAGQYVRVGVDVDGVRHWRSYSLTCPPSLDDGCLSVTVQAIDGGLVSRHLTSAVPVGTVLQLTAAAGEFVLPDPVPDRLLLVTAGSGLTPVMAMLRTLVQAGPLPDTVLLHSAPTVADTLFLDELHAFAEHDGLALRIQPTRETGRLDLADLGRLCPDWRTRSTWACGPVALLDALERHWTAHGVQDLLHVERFTAPRRAGGAGGSVAFSRTGTTAAADGGTSLLEAGESAGVLLPSGCRMGICFTCVVPLRAGRVRDLRTGELHGDDGALVQTCVSAAAGDVDLDV
jgi:stearoyl-CoA 9-desaturase NADPH oxidoreductase